eukprot:951850_1
MELVYQTSIGKMMNHNLNNSYRIRTHSRIKILQWNVDGLKSKQQYFQYILDLHNIDVAALQEARKTRGSGNLPPIDGYKRYGDKYGRTAIYIKKGLVHSHIPHRILPNLTTNATDDFTHTLWRTWIRIKGESKHKDLIIGSAYKPNRHEKEYAASAITKDIQQIARHYYESNQNKYKWVCCADFNITHTMLGAPVPTAREKRKAQQHKEGQDLVDTCIEQGIQILNGGQSTHTSRSTKQAGWLDWTIGSHNLDKERIKWRTKDVDKEDKNHKYNGKCDHKMILFETNGHHSNETERKWRWNLSDNLDWDEDFPSKIDQYLRRWRSTKQIESKDTAAIDECLATSKGIKSVDAMDQECKEWIRGMFRACDAFAGRIQYDTNEPKWMNNKYRIASKLVKHEMNLLDDCVHHDARDKKRRKRLRRNRDKLRKDLIKKSVDRQLRNQDLSTQSPSDAFKTVKHLQTHQNNDIGTLYNQETGNVAASTRKEKAQIFRKTFYDSKPHQYDQQ